MTPENVGTAMRIKITVNQRQRIGCQVKYFTLLQYFQYFQSFQALFFLL